MIRDWLRRKEIEAFALDLAQDLGRRFPPQSEQRKDKAVRNQLSAIVSALYRRAAGFAQARGLGVYGKAKLGNTFRWHLRELGYSDPLIESVTHELVLNLSSKAR